MDWVSQEREALKESWANGSFSASLDAEMIAKNAGATGACSAYFEILNVEFEDLYGEDDE